MGRVEVREKLRISDRTTLLEDDVDKLEGWMRWVIVTFVGMIISAGIAFLALALNLAFN